MEMWISKKLCTGCGVCSNICPKGAIKMVEDKCGFKYPVINQEKCINCGLCKNTCPILKKKENNNRNVPIVYAAWSKDEDIRFTSTSGGAFTEIAKVILKNNGVVIGAKYNDENMVEHSIARTEKELEGLKQSKYLQSDTKRIFFDVKKILDEGKLVAFVGSPCQIGGLYKYLKKDYDNLLTIDFICRGVNSPKAYKSWLKEISENNGNKKIVKVWFKYKINGWKKSPTTTKIDFDDGTYKIYTGDENSFMSGYLGPNLYIRPSCGNCQFKQMPRQADITLADFWKINKEYDDDKGTSLIMVNSEKGEHYLSLVSNLNLNEKKFEDVYAGNAPILFKSVKINKKSEKFLQELDNYSFSYLLCKYGKDPFYLNLYNNAKKVAKKIIKR